MKKYGLTAEFIEQWGKKLFRIKALISFGSVEAGELGGYVEKEDNLAQDGDAWVYGNARVYGDAEVYGNAMVYGNARVYGNAEVYGDAEVYGNARVYDDARVCGDAEVYGNARVCGNAEVCGDAEVCDDARVCGNARVCGDARVYGDAMVYGNADYLLIGRIGSRFSFTTFFKNKDKGITVSCGCFLGTIAEFRAKVTDTHGNNKHAKIYNLAADMAELQILGEEYFDKLNANKSEPF
jgi:carbonic anhydrase/acetyltransferase-like protein (isoleucine patch superfamily)